MSLFSEMKQQGGKPVVFAEHTTFAERSMQGQTLVVCESRGVLFEKILGICLDDQIQQEIELVRRSIGYQGSKHQIRIGVRENFLQFSSTDIVSLEQVLKPDEDQV